MRRLRNRQKGFTLIELLIVVAIIGIIAALLIPNFIDALHKGRQKRTMGDIRQFGTGLAMYYTDHSGAAAAGAASTIQITTADWSGAATYDEMTAAMIPDYTQDIPLTDGWGNDLVYQVELDPSAQNYALVASGGRDGSAIAATYTVGPFEATDYDQDIVWADGTFVRRPASN